MNRASIRPRTVQWLVPSQVVIGSHGFGELRGAVRDSAELRPLWDALGVSVESAQTAHKLLEEIAAGVHPDHVWRPAMVQALRYLADVPSAARPNLKRVPLRCGDRWVRARPVYACVHPAIADALHETVPVWTPVCDPSSLGDLPDDLDVTVVDVTEHSQVTIEHKALRVGDLTTRFRAAARNFRALLEKHEPGLDAALTVPWHELEEAVVGVSPTLAASVTAGQVQLQVDLMFAHDPKFGVVIRDGGSTFLDATEVAEELLVFFFRSSEDGMAPLYRASLYWAEAWRQAESGYSASPLDLERTEPEDEVHDDEQLVFALRVTGVRPDRTPEGESRRNGKPDAPGSRLKRPEDIALIQENVTEVDTPDDSPTETEGTTGSSQRWIPISTAPEPPKKGRRITKGSAPTEDTEELGWRVVEAILDKGDDPQLRDLRARRDVGADGYDPRRDKAIELKAHRGPIPDSIRLQNSQIREARDQQRGYWLFVVGGLATGYDLEVRLIADPLRYLDLADQPSVKFEGVKRAKTLARWVEGG